MPSRVAFYTLGCKLNQLETESFADAFVHGAWAVLPFDDEKCAADLVIINTCTVTGKAEQKARRIIRRALSDNPAAVVLITGCYAEVEPETLAALDERALILPGRCKEALLGLPVWLAARGEGGAFIDALREWLACAIGASALGGGAAFAYNPEVFAFHTRPALKIQDGCDNACAYCRVRIARGRAVSLAAAEVLARVRVLEEAGRAEIVLTGVNLSQYRDGDVDFPALLNLLIAGTQRIAFRLSSYEPDRIDAAFLDAFAHPRVRPHIHLAVQSGADPVLMGMGRNYRRADVLSAVDSLRRVKGSFSGSLWRGPFIAADLIAGFPGETEDDAAATMELARDCDFAWIHVFRFSPRPGTRASSMPNRVPERLVRERVEALLDLAKVCRTAYIDRWIEAELSAILEVGLGATSSNYLKLKIRGLPEEARPGQTVICRINEGRCISSEEDVDAFALYIQPEY